MTIRDSEHQDCYDLAETLQEQDKLEAIRLGWEPVKGILNSYRLSIYRKTALIDGKIAAMFGIHGTPLAEIGRPYFMTGTLARSLSPIRFARIYLEQADVMNRLFPVLENYVDSTYTQSIRLLELAGFSLKETVIFNNHPFIRFERRQEWV